MNTRVELTIIAAEKALKELIAEGKKISQYAIEKKAGLGTLSVLNVSNQIK